MGEPIGEGDKNHLFVPKATNGIPTNPPSPPHGIPPCALERGIKLGHFPPEETFVAEMQKALGQAHSI